jgi:hypothetical protein
MCFADGAFGWYETPRLVLVTSHGEGWFMVGPSAQRGNARNAVASERSNAGKCGQQNSGHAVTHFVTEIRQ